MHRPLDGWSGCEAWLTTPEASTRVLEASEVQAKLVHQVSPTGLWRLRGGYHEGYNKGMRGAGDFHATFEDDGDVIARRWREAACGMSGYFVLRDALFNQQDHPVAQRRARALMIPPSWVVQAAWLVRRGEEVQNVRCEPVERDDAWRGVAQGSAEEAFGSFDPSSSLFTALGAPLDGDEVLARRARNARESMCALAAHVEALQEGAWRGGWREVIATGAERIAWGDREYFGEKLRAEVFIPIFVENPDEHERGEGKGLEWSGAGEIWRSGSAQDRAMLQEVLGEARQRIYGRRLQDGPMALERYDLSSQEERARLVAILRELAPASSPPPHALWIWVTGRLDAGAKLKGESALRYLADFKAELSENEIALHRVEWLSKPAMHVAKKDRARLEALQREALLEHERAGLRWMSVTQVVQPAR